MHQVVGEVKETEDGLPVVDARQQDQHSNVGHDEVKVVGRQVKVHRLQTVDAGRLNIES